MNSNNREGRYSQLEEALRLARTLKRGKVLVQRPLGRTIQVRITLEGDGMFRDLGEGDAPFYL